MKRLILITVAVVVGALLGAVVSAQQLQGSNVQVQRQSVQLQSAPSELQPALDVQPATCVGQ